VLLSYLFPVRLSHIRENALGNIKNLYFDSLDGIRKKHICLILHRKCHTCQVTTCLRTYPQQPFDGVYSDVFTKYPLSFYSVLEYVFSLSLHLILTHKVAKSTYDSYHLRYSAPSFLDSFTGHCWVEINRKKNLKSHLWQYRFRYGVLKL
jgi:hypothetical protein